jgi:hypothetical protein
MLSIPRRRLTSCLRNEIWHLSCHRNFRIAAAPAYGVSSAKFPEVAATAHLIPPEEWRRFVAENYPPIKNLSGLRLLRVANAGLDRRGLVRKACTPSIPSNGDEIREARSRISGFFIPPRLESQRDIRLFRLVETPQGPRLEFRVASLDGPLDYVAISYAWSDDKEVDVWKTVEGSDIPVTKALNILLREHISRLGPQWVWIDALCIDQDNIPEKTYQVRHMKRIYATAKSVNVWLGAGSPAKDRAFKRIWNMLHCLGPDIDHPESPPKTYLQESTLDIDQEWSILEPIFELPWFQRVWVVQEVTVATRAQCGLR